MSITECKLSTAYKEAFYKLLEHQYVDTPNLIKSGTSNVTEVIESNSRTFSASLEGIAADQKRNNDYLYKHIVDVDRDFESLLAALISNRPGRSASTVSEAGHNATIATIAEELDVLKGRQAASAALQVVQFFLFAGYLITLAVLYVVKKCKKYRKKQDEEEVELMEQKLQDRKARRRAAATRAKGKPSPNQE